MTCYARQHMTLEEYGLWTHAREVSYESRIFYLDARGTAKRFSSTGKNAIYRVVDSLVRKGWFEVVKESRRLKIGIFAASQYRPLSHDEWAHIHPGMCTSPEIGTGQPVQKSGQAATSPEIVTDQSRNQDSPVQKSGHSREGGVGSSCLEDIHTHKSETENQTPEEKQTPTIPLEGKYPNPEPAWYLKPKPEWSVHDISTVGERLAREWDYEPSEDPDFETAYLEDYFWFMELGERLWYFAWAYQLDIDQAYTTTLQLPDWFERLDAIGQQYVEYNTECGDRAWELRKAQTAAASQTTPPQPQEDTMAAAVAPIPTEPLTVEIAVTESTAAGAPAPVPVPPKKPCSFAEFTKKVTRLHCVIQPKSFRPFSQTEQAGLIRHWARTLSNDATYKRHHAHIAPVGMDTSGNLRVAISTQQFADEIWDNVGGRLVETANQWDPGIKVMFYMAPKEAA